jgi:hypothetical protein
MPSVSPISRCGHAHLFICRSFFLLLIFLFLALLLVFLIFFVLLVLLIFLIFFVLALLLDLLALFVFLLWLRRLLDLLG